MAGGAADRASPSIAVSTPLMSRITSATVSRKSEPSRRASPASRPDR